MSRARGVRPTQRVPDVIVDIGVAAIVAFPTLMDAWWNQPGTRQADWLTYLLGVVSVVALVFRRRAPFAVALVCGAALTGWYVLGHHGELLNLPTMVALYTVAVRTDRRTVVITGIVAATWSGVLGATSDDPLGARGGSPVLEMLWPLIPLVLGEAIRSGRELAVRITADREQETRRQVDAERVRIAREFHDVVAHTMSAVNVQLSVAVAAFDSQPDTAEAALVQARASARDAMRELRASVALLRDADQADPWAPAPRLAQVEDLATTTRGSGIDVTIDRRGHGDELPAAVELAAYRVVQEALTNVVRHSSAASVRVSIDRRDDALIVDVEDDGVGPTQAARDSGGHGLLGMHERVAALGGRLEHGPADSGGFRVHAAIPLTGPPE